MDVAIGPEFQNTLKDFPCDQLFVVDPFVLWYMQDREENWKGYDRYVENISKYTTK